MSSFLHKENYPEKHSIPFHECQVVLNASRSHTLWFKMLLKVLQGVYGVLSGLFNPEGCYKKRHILVALLA